MLHSQVMQRQLAKVALLVSVFSVRGFGFALRLEPAVVCFGACLLTPASLQCTGVWLCRCTSVLVAAFDASITGVWLSFSARVWLCRCTRVCFSCTSVLVAAASLVFG